MQLLEQLCASQGGLATYAALQCLLLIICYMGQAFNVHAK